jgi:formate hydrogenlyase subunit 3/multisubunit Na+/H+ antiporter MnhD subunit
MTTPGGALVALAVLLPFLGAVVAFALGGRRAQYAIVVTIVINLAITGLIGHALYAGGEPLVYELGGWSPPLGIALRADGMAAAMLVAIAVVVAGIALFARADFGTPAGASETRAALMYWTLLSCIVGALNLVFVSGDLFTLYVALEVLTFAAVPLVCLEGSGETLRSALRYLLFALAGSILYLLGAVLLYAEYGTLDIALLAEAIEPGIGVSTAAALMTVGLLAKTALFPLHLWLPPAHAGAPAAASAVLSALVVKGSWFLVVRLWIDLFPPVLPPSAAQLLGALGAGAILVGNLVALRQARLKLLVAYSTVAQIGYLFLMFPLAATLAAQGQDPTPAVSAGILQAISHATAKAGMFMAAGLIYASLGHDRIAELAGAARPAPLAVLAFAVGGLALTGTLPSGAYLAKKLLLDAAAGTGQWWWAVVLYGGGFLTMAYVVLVLMHVLRAPADSMASQTRAGIVPQIAALALALGSLLLALLSQDWASTGLKADEWLDVLATIAGGTVLALVLGRSLPEVPRLAAPLRVGRPLRSAGVATAALFERGDALLRGWPVATLSLLAIALAFGAIVLGGA